MSPAGNNDDLFVLLSAVQTFCAMCELPSGAGLGALGILGGVRRSSDPRPFGI